MIDHQEPFLPINWDSDMYKRAFPQSLLDVFFLPYTKKTIIDPSPHFKCGQAK